MIRTPRQYQVHAVDRIARLIGKGIRSIIFQLATGGGKSVTFALLIHRYLQKYQKKVVIMVHREELLQQACRTLWEWYDIAAAPITAETKYIPNVMVYVTMVETANNRLKKNPKYFGDNVGMVIYDEAHRGEFKKTFPYFKESVRIGFTATPLAADRKDPLKNYYQEIVCGIDIPDLIAMNRKDPTTGLVRNITIHEKNIVRSELKVKGGEFDEQQTGEIFSRSMHVLNAVKAYKENSLGKKTVIFNVNIKHSLKVTEAFKSFGYNCRHLDGEMDKRERRALLKWFEETPDAVLCNVGVATTGFDYPSIRTVMTNFPTKSLTKWLQCDGRGSRPDPGKDFFLILDLGGNAEALGDWSVPHNWEQMFKDPETWFDRKGEPPSKVCKGCSKVIHAAQNICPYCGADNSRRIVYDQGPITLELLMSQKPTGISVKGLIREHAGKVNAKGEPFKDISVLHTIKYRLVTHAKRVWKIRTLDDPTAFKILKMYQGYVMEWCKEKGRIDEFDQWLGYSSKKWLFESLESVFGWQPANKREKLKA